MSFNALVSGADCGPVNPLAQMVKHAEADRSLQKDHIGPSGSGAQLHHLPSTSAAHAPNIADAALHRQFFEGGAPPSAGPMQHVAPFQAPRGMPMGHGSAPVSFQGPMKAGSEIPVAGDSFQDVWARNASGPLPAPEGLQMASPSSGPQILEPGVSGQPPIGAMRAPFPMGMHAGFAGPQMMAAYGPMATAQRPQHLDWDEQFSRVSDQDAKGKGKARIVEVDPNLSDLDKAFQQLSAEDKQKEASQPDYMSDFEKTWAKMNLNPQNASDMAKWESEYNQVLQSQREDGERFTEQDLDHDYGAAMKEAWETRYSAGLDPDFVEKQMRLHFDEDGFPNLPEYQFEPNNPNLATPGPTLLAKAKQYLANNGSLSEAALMLEAAIRKGELGEGGYEAWILLGETRSMDEREDVGLLALRQGVEIAKEGGHIGPGMLSLAVSYTNESYELASNNVLREWLLSKYPDANVLPFDHATVTSWRSREIVTAAFLSVAQRLHAKGKSDPDVQVGLGILYYSEGEYDKAKDCFESALWARPDDYLLWNRLGSCLSNGSKPEEALNVYREALRLRPTYTRAIFNVGVACLNIGAYKEAAEHFLSALAIQKTASGGVPSPDASDGRNEQLWKTLRKAFSLMEREDLAGLTNKGDVAVFRQHGFDF